MSVCRVEIPLCLGRESAMRYREVLLRGELLRRGPPHSEGGVAAGSKELRNAS